MKIQEIIDIIDKFAPANTAEDWDNVGLMIGSVDRECSGVMIALDLTLEVAKQSVKEGCNLIVTHHPFFFKAINRIDVDETKGEIIETLLKNQITSYAAHTNLDKAEGGICWKLAELFDGTDIINDGVGTMFTMPSTTLENFAKKVGLRLADKSVKVVGNPDKRITKVYVVSGGGGGELSLYERAKDLADVFVTGDIKHHIYVEALNDGFPLVEFSHFNSEIVVQSIIYDLLAPKCQNVKIKKAVQGCPYRILEEL